MKIDEIKLRVEGIDACKGDPEHAHVLEDKLHQDVLQAIADGDLFPFHTPAECAKAALSTSRIRFDRWYA